MINDAKLMLKNYRRTLAEKREYELRGDNSLSEKISEKSLEIERINNAMSILTEDERTIIDLHYIKGYSIEVVISRINKSYSRTKALEGEALKKMNSILNA